MENSYAQLLIGMAMGGRKFHGVRYLRLHAVAVQN